MLGCHPNARRAGRGPFFEVNKYRGGSTNSVILVLQGREPEVPKGGYHGLVGRQWRGKTTTLKAVSNLLHSETREVTKGRSNTATNAVH